MTNELKNLLLTGLGIALTISLGLIGYTYLTKDITPKGISSKKNLTFEKLPPSIQQGYIPREEHFEALEKVEKEKDLLAYDLEGIISDSKQQDFLKKTAKMQKDLDEQIIQENGEKSIQTKRVSDRSKFKTYTCKSFQKGSINVPASCKKALYKFLDRYKKDAKEFELIGMVDETEFKLIQSLEDVYGTDEVTRVKKYVQVGLSRQRVIETTWLVKERLKKSIKVGAVNYTVYSGNKRGFVIRAYF